jgi:hypothetical protein
MWNTKILGPCYCKLARTSFNDAQPRADPQNQTRVYITLNPNHAPQRSRSSTVHTHISFDPSTWQGRLGESRQLTEASTHETHSPAGISSLSRTTRPPRTRALEQGRSDSPYCTVKPIGSSIGRSVYPISLLLIQKSEEINNLTRINSIVRFTLP